MSLDSYRCNHCGGEIIHVDTKVKLRASSAMKYTPLKDYKLDGDMNAMYCPVCQTIQLGVLGKEELYIRRNNQ